MMYGTPFLLNNLDSRKHLKEYLFYLFENQFNKKNASLFLTKVYEKLFYAPFKSTRHSQNCSYRSFNCYSFSLAPKECLK